MASRCEQVLPITSQARCVCAHPVLLLGLCICWLSIFNILSAQSSKNFLYSHDDAGRLTKVSDSFGNEIDYVYDAAGNLIKVNRGSSPAGNVLSILGFTPQAGAVGNVITIQGQNFSETPSLNAAKVNSTVAEVLSATTNQLLISVPGGASTGPISVTVNRESPRASDNRLSQLFPLLLCKPSVHDQWSAERKPSIFPELQVTGSNLTGSTFSFSPAFMPAAVAVNSATIDPSGTSATLNVTVAPRRFRLLHPHRHERLRRIKPHRDEHQHAACP